MTARDFILECYKLRTGQGIKAEIYLIEQEHQKLYRKEVGKKVSEAKLAVYYGLRILEGSATDLIWQRLDALENGVDRDEHELGNKWLYNMKEEQMEPKVGIGKRGPRGKHVKVFGKYAAGGTLRWLRMKMGDKFSLIVAMELNKSLGLNLAIMSVSVQMYNKSTKLPEITRDDGRKLVRMVKEIIEDPEKDSQEES